MRWTLSAIAFAQRRHWLEFIAAFTGARSSSPSCTGAQKWSGTSAASASALRHCHSRQPFRGWTTPTWGSISPRRCHGSKLSAPWRGSRFGARLPAPRGHRPPLRDRGWRRARICPSSGAYPRDRSHSGRGSIAREHEQRLSARHPEGGEVWGDGRTGRPGGLRRGVRRPTQRRVREAGSAANLFPHARAEADRPRLSVRRSAAGAGSRSRGPMHRHGHLSGLQRLLLLLGQRQPARASDPAPERSVALVCDALLEAARDASA